ncbi:Hypothetical predicted protein [Paramuricea clavata]|uniref:Uncharacterized protein n=1 Tax=Paramuricea clavata TaxID=317549 RepID=A0A7D9LVD9_PARCT|nr:Hypothetical predicted protein [Paramuricea clavata]
MPVNADVDLDRVQQLVEGGGIKPETLKKRAKSLDALENFLKSKHGTSLEQALISANFENLLMAYFESLRVQQRDESGNVSYIIPKRKKMESNKSNLKLAILTKTENKVDILNHGRFPKLTQLQKGVSKAYADYSARTIPRR